MTALSRKVRSEHRPTKDKLAHRIYEQFAPLDEHNPPLRFPRRAFDETAQAGAKHD
jgi:hypothetical protein